VRLNPRSLKRARPEISVAGFSFSGANRLKKQTINWPADQVERRAVDSLVPYARNARTHSPAQVDQLAASIKEWGWTVPVLIDETGGIIAGHGRVLAAHKLGLADIPVMTARGWSEAKRRAYVIADNKLAMNAGWDDDLLRVELGELQLGGIDLGLLGFETDELASLFAESSTGQTDPDDVPEPPAVPVSAVGDVWILGRHRIACGDCTDAGIVAKALNGVEPHLMVTDPPYGVSYDPSWRNGLDKAKNRRTGAVANDDRSDWREAWALFPGHIAYIWHGGLHSSSVAESLLAAGFDLRAQIIWAKQKMVFGRGDYHWQHEPCWYAVKGTGRWAGDRKQTTLWTIDNLNLATKQASENDRTNHSTQKPVECMARPIRNNSSPGQAVYEPFSGSGTTIIAGEMTGRHVHAIELNPAYVDVAVERWQAFTGKAAVLEADGRSFAETKEARLNGPQST
jgi:DNA modification methylase